MALTENHTATTGEDAAAIAELHQLVAPQRAAFLADPFPVARGAPGTSGALAGMLVSHRTESSRL